MGWKINITLNEPYRDKEVFRMVELLREQQYIRLNSIFDIEINGFSDYTVFVTTDRDGVKDAIIDTCQRCQSYPNTVTAEEI